MAHVFETQPIEVERFYTGLISQRNKLAIPIRIFGRRLIELYDAILTGSNAELSVRSTVVRSPGHIQYNTNPVSGIPQKFYSFQQASTQLLFPVVDTTTGVFYVPPGATAPSTLISKAQGRQSSFFGVGNYLYIGNPEFSNKWDGPGGPQGITKWGIAIGSVNNSAGPNLAGNGVNGSGSGVNWTNPNNITSIGVFATATIGVGSVTFSNPLKATQFAFAIPAGSTILGIQATVNVSFTGGNLTNQQSVSLQLLKNGNPIGNVEVQQLFGPNFGPSVVTFGGTSDLWGVNWTLNDINQSTFGFQLVAGSHLNATNFSVNSGKITIFFLGGPPISVNAGAGSFSATQGYQYLFVYGNSNDNNISNPTPASSSTGVFTNKLEVDITLTASTDPQVNQIRVFRTTDTGTGAVFFELPNSPFPNVSGSVADAAPDTLLQITQAVVVGSLAFSPPPAGLVNIEWYAGRLWGSVGNLLYFSAGPDNAPMGKGTSNWPPGNVFELPTTIVKLVALNGGNGMLIVTLDQIHVAQGISNPGFTVNRWLSDVGARQQNAVDTDGSNVYIFTSDRQFLKISAQGIDELSQNVSDQTDNFDPTLVYVMQHRSGSQDSRVFLTNGSTQWIPYNLMMGAWEPARTFADGAGVGAIGSIEIAPGSYKLLKGSTAAGSVIQQRDLNTFTDNGSAYSWQLTFGNIPVADPTQLANIESIVLRWANLGNDPNLFVLPNDISGSFTQLLSPVQEPPEAVTGPSGHRAERWYLNSAAGPLWTQMTHLQMKITFGADTVQNELLSWGIFPNQSTDQATQQLPQIQGR